MNDNISGRKRIVAIRHRMKTLVTGELHPTEVVIHDLPSGESRKLIFDDQEQELLFLDGQFGSEGAFEGLAPGDLLVTMTGGSGDAFVYALAGRYMKQDVRFMRTPSFNIRDNRHDPEDSSADADVLCDMVRKTPHLFAEMTEKDLQFIFISTAWPAYEQAMRARIAYAQRLSRVHHDQAYVLASEITPKQVFDKRGKKAGVTDSMLALLEKEEALRLDQVVHALGELDIYNKIFLPIEGIGPKLAGRLISTILDIRRFPSEAKLMAYLGVHTLAGPEENPGERIFARQRRGSRANWSGTARQALFLFAEQANKRPDSEWGIYLRKIKKNLREKHPESTTVPGSSGKMVKKYTDAHIHKMASWRTATRFVRKLYRAWYHELGMAAPRKRKDRLRLAA